MRPWGVRGQDLGQETERIREEIEVVNVEVPVRVYYKKKPVKDLEKKDFTFIIDKKEREINGFYEVRKVIKTSPSQTTPRLFILMFNVVSYDEYLQKGVETLFGKVIRPGDRLMVLTNNMFLKDKMVGDPKEELEKLKKVLHIESLKMKQALASFEYNLRYLASSFKLQCNSYQREGERLALIVDRFVEEYRDKRGRMVVQLLGNVTFRDYQFFAIETRVTQEARE